MLFIKLPSMKSLPPYLQEVVALSHLTGKERKDLEKELLSHYVVAAKDFEQGGVKNEEIEDRLRQQFGNSKSVAAQIKKVHWEWSLSKKIIFYLSLVIVFIGPVWVLLLSSMNTFILTFIIITLLVSALLHLLFLFISVRRQLDSKPLVASGIIISLAVIVQWVVLVFSERSLLQQDIWNDPMSVAGFPFKSLYYPNPPLGGDYVPFSMWPKFYMNYGFWLLVVLCAYPFLPPRFKNKKAQKLLIIIAFVVSLLMFLYLLFKFD